MTGLWISNQLTKKKYAHEIMYERTYLVGKYVYFQIFFLKLTNSGELLLKVTD